MTLGCILTAWLRLQERRQELWRLNPFFPDIFLSATSTHFRSFVKPEAGLHSLHVRTTFGHFQTPFGPALTHITKNIQHIFRPAFLKNTSSYRTQRFHMRFLSCSLDFPFMFPSCFLDFPFMFLFIFPSCFFHSSFTSPSCSIHFSSLCPSFSIHCPFISAHRPGTTAPPYAAEFISFSSRWAGSRRGRPAAKVALVAMVAMGCLKVSLCE